MGYWRALRCSVDVKVQVSCCLLELRRQSGQDEEQNLEQHKECDNNPAKGQSRTPVKCKSGMNYGAFESESKGTLFLLESEIFPGSS